MDFVLVNKLAKERYEEMLDEAAIERRAHSANDESNRVSLMARIENMVADMKFWRKSARKNEHRTAVTSS